MELIKISSSQLKIMLSSEDMDSFDLDCADADRNTPKAREAFKRILKKAKEMSGFDIGSEKLFIQLYPSRSGGCELFVSKIEPGDKLANADVSPHVQDVYSAELTDRTLDNGSVESKMRHVSANNIICAWKFDSFSNLLDACKRLFYHADMIPASSLYRDENAKYHLLLEIDGKEKRFAEQSSLFMSEYGESEKSDMLLMYIFEHGYSICSESAIETLSEL